MKIDKTFLKRTIPALGLLGVGFITAILLTVPYQEVVENPERLWHRNVLAADNTVGYGTSHVENIYIYPHQPDPATAYASNLTEAAAYGHFDSDPVSGDNLGNDIPYGTPFDIVVEVVWNTTHAYNSVNSTWMGSWVRGNYTSTVHGETDLAMGEIQIMTNSTCMKVNYYANNGGAGYQISRGQSVNSSDYFTGDAYY